MAKDPRLNFSNGPGITRTVAAFLPRRLFESDSNNDPSPGHSNLGQMENTLVQMENTSVQVPTCGLLVSALAGQEPRLDFIDPGIICIVAAFWPTGVYLSPTQIMAPLQVISILVK